MMLAAIWETVKGILFGKGTTQVGSNNKSVSNITGGENTSAIVVGDGNVVQFGKPDKEDAKTPLVPRVEVRMALTHHPILGFAHFIAITILNCTQRSIFIGNFMVERTDKHNVYFQADDATGERQKKRELKAGDKFSFHVSARTFHEMGLPSSDYVCALVEDAVGPPYKSDPVEFQKAVAEVMKEKQ